MYVDVAHTPCLPPDYFDALDFETAAKTRRAAAAAEKQQHATPTRPRREAAAAVQQRQKQGRKEGRTNGKFFRTLAESNEMNYDFFTAIYVDVKRSLAQ